MKKCFICDNFLKGNEHYNFRYLFENVDLCGSCARNIMDYIKSERKFLIDLSNTKKKYLLGENDETRNN